MARMMSVNEADIHDAGYFYNSSLNPIFLPGKYNNFTKPKQPFYKNEVLNIPASVSTVLRIPLFWLSFKNFPLSAYKLLSASALRKNGFLNIYFHPWEFVDLSNYDIPNFVKKHSKDIMINRLEKYVLWLKNKAEFITMNQFFEIRKKKLRK